MNTVPTPVGFVDAVEDQKGKRQSPYLQPTPLPHIKMIAHRLLLRLPACWSPSPQPRRRSLPAPEDSEIVGKVRPCPRMRFCRIRELCSSSRSGRTADGE